MKKTISRAGIIGGMGPHASSKFCLNVNMKFRALANRLPSLVLENLPISAEAENDLINGKSSHIHKALLMEAISKLNNADVDIIAILCNTVHCFLEELRSLSNRPILSIIEECAKECERANFRKIGLLATTKTIQEKLFENELTQRGVDVIVPSLNNQKEVSSIILNVLNNSNTTSDKEKIIEMINELERNGAQAVILGCTELSLLVSSQDCSINLLETDRILEDSLVQMLMNNNGTGGTQ